MGLDVIVGAMGTAADDPGYSAHLRGQFDAVSRALENAGLPGYREPDIAPADVYETRIGSYLTMHTIGRVALHLAATGALPSPWPRDGEPNDPMLASYFAGEPPSTAGAPGFPQLLEHSWAEGYYVPVDFPEPIGSDDVEEIAGVNIGSSPALRRELERIAAAIGYPRDLDPDDYAASAKLLGGQGVGDGWRAYAVESLACARLLRAAERSVAMGAAIQFA